VLDNVAFSSQYVSMIDEGSPDDHPPDDDTSLPPMIPLPHEKSLLNVTLVISDDDASVVVGVRLSSPIDNILATHWLHCKLKLQAYPLSKVKAKCYQLSGHLSNDGKQINILTGQRSCSMGYPMPCCMVHKGNLGRPIPWVRLLLRQTAWSLPCTFSDTTVEKISQFVGKPVYPDPPAREGTFSSQSTHTQWKQLTVDGNYTLIKEERSKDNQETGTSFNEPNFSFPCKKQNCGIMHDPAGHITHYMNKITTLICEKKKECNWQLRLHSIDAEVKANIFHMKTAKKSITCLG